MSMTRCARDVVRARFLIDEGARLFGHGAMVDAVQLQASQDQTEAMDAVRRREADPGDRWPGDPEPYEFEEEWPEHEPR